MTDDRLASERDLIARRVADFRQTQARFQRAREDHYEQTIERIREIRWNQLYERTLSN